MAENHVELTKQRVKYEFSQAKNDEPGLKLGHMFNRVARREGFKDWNIYRAYLLRLPE